jgi:hypothetical protein
MARAPKIGEYRHRPAAQMVMGADGVLRPDRKRRRFPFRGIVLLAYGLIGPGVCASVSALFQAAGWRNLLPQRISGPLPPSPTLNNILFGAGLPETVLACALAGYWLWSNLWKRPVPDEAQAKGPRATLPHLLGPALVQGALLALAGIPIQAFGLFLRTAPDKIPWYVRPFFGIPATVVASFSELLTGIIPLVAVVLGLLLGLVTAIAVAYAWPHFPEEAVLK